MIRRVKRKHRKELTPIVSGLSLILSVTALVIALNAGQAEPVRTSEPAPTRHYSGVGRHSVIETETTAETEAEAEPVEVKPIKAEPAIVVEPTSLGTFKLTAYCPCSKCCGQWADGITYTGTEATAGRTIAVDPNVIPLGSTVHINGQAYTAEDIGGAIKGNRIDIYFPTHTEALQFGVQYAEVSID